MRFVTAEVAGKEALGVLVDQDMIMLAPAYEAILREQGKKQSAIPANMIDFIKGGAGSLNIAKECIEYVNRSGTKANDLVRHEGEYRMLAPIPQPPTIHVVAVNNRRTLEASRGTNVSGNPLICMKAPSSVIGDQETIMIPSPNSLQMVTAAMKLKDSCSLEEKL